MSSRRVYALQRSGNLLWLKAAVKSATSEPRVIRLLVDTGSSFTVLPVAILEEIGCCPAESSPKVIIMAAGGAIQPPMVIVPKFI